MTNYESFDTQTEGTRKLEAITQSFDKVLTQNQTEVESLKNEQSRLRTTLLDIIAENKRMSSKLEAGRQLSAMGESRDDATHEWMTNDALKNVKKQIDNLQAEKEELRLLNRSSQKIIQSLESELQSYRQQFLNYSGSEDIKHKYSNVIKLLENTIKAQKLEICKQAADLESCVEQNQQLTKHVENLESSLIAKEHELRQNGGNSIAETLKIKLIQFSRQNRDLQKSLKTSKRVIEERFERERCALRKVQEALTIASEAVHDKEDAQRREQVVKEECDNLASTIGEIMDEAAKRVEKDMEMLRKKFSEKERMLADMQVKLTDELQNQLKFNQILETRCNRFEQKFRKSSADNERMEAEMHTNRDLIDELKLKLHTRESELKEYDITKKRAEEQEREIQQYLETNKQLKDKYKSAVDELTKRFEKEIHVLQKENAMIKAENQVIKVKRRVLSELE